jgi:hypothetical protein
MEVKKRKTRKSGNLRVLNSVALTTNIVTTNSVKCQPVHREDGRKIGKVVGNTFTKSVKGSIHFLRTPPCIAFDIFSLKEAVKLGATKVQVTDLETGCVYTASIKHILNKGMRINRGHGEQIALSMNGWMKMMPGVAYQQPLFGGQDVS